MAARRENPIKDDERQAIIALRNEYLRKNIVINKLFNDLD